MFFFILRCCLCGSGYIADSDVSNHTYSIHPIQAVRIHIHPCMHIYMHMHINMHVNLTMQTHIHIHTCVHVLTCIHIHTHTVLMASFHMIVKPRLFLHLP